MKEYINSIALALGGRFEPRDDTLSGATYGTVVLPDGVRFWIHGGGYGMENRIEVSSYYPDHQSNVHGGVQRTVQRDFDREVPYHKAALRSITFSASTNPEKAARDIERRYLKEYRALYAAAIVWCDAQATYWSGKAALEQAARHHLSQVRYASDRRIYADLGHVGGYGCTVNVHNLCAADVAKLAKFLSGL